MKQTSKKKVKQKIVFAKDPKQAALAIIVVCVFFINGIYQIVKYNMDQNAMNNPTPAPTTESAALNPSGQTGGDLAMPEPSLTQTRADIPPTIPPNGINEPPNVSENTPQNINNDKNNEFHTYVLNLSPLLIYYIAFHFFS